MGERLVCPACKDGLLAWKTGRCPEESADLGTAALICERCGAETTLEKMTAFSRVQPPPGWLPMRDAPFDAEVLLTGSSGCIKPHDRFVVNGYRKLDWHAGRWNDATGELLDDRGWEPDGWRPLSQITSPDEVQVVSNPVLYEGGSYTRIGSICVYVNKSVMAPPPGLTLDVVATNKLVDGVYLTVAVCREWAPRHVSLPALRARVVDIFNWQDRDRAVFEQRLDALLDQLRDGGLR